MGTSLHKVFTVKREAYQRQSVVFQQWILINKKPRRLPNFFGNKDLRGPLSYELGVLSSEFKAQ